MRHQKNIPDRLRAGLGVLATAYVRNSLGGSKDAAKSVWESGLIDE
jgi:hypothetical protein